MKEVLTVLARYHYWANEKLLEAILKLPPEMPMREMTSSFPSLFKTFAHLYKAEQVWLLRLKQNENPLESIIPFEGTFDVLAEKILAHNKEMIEWIKAQKEAFLVHPVAFYDFKKQYFKTTAHQCLLHVFNHGSYHRGQAITLLRELGSTRLPATDYMAFIRLKQ